MPGLSAFSVFLWLLFGVYWLINIWSFPAMPYCYRDLLMVGGWLEGESFLQRMMWIVTLAGVVWVLRFVAFARPARHWFSLSFQFLMVLGLAAHLAVQYAYYYPKSLAGRIVHEQVLPSVTRDRQISYSVPIIIEPVYPPSVAALLAEAREEIANGAHADRPHDIIVYTDETYGLLRYPPFWRAAFKQYMSDYAYEKALQECVAEYDRFLSKSDEYAYPFRDNIMLIERVGFSPLRRARYNLWPPSEERLRERYPDFYAALDAEREAEEARD